MQKLNIQLGNTKTTRPPRRVVWLLGLILASAYGSAWLAVNWTRSMELAKTVPDGTILTLVFNPNRTNTEAIRRVLGGLALISNKNLAYSDIEPLIRQEFAIYWLQDGSRAIGIQAKTDQLPIKTWDNAGIKVQEIGKRRFILSDRTLAMKPIRPGFSIDWPKINVFSQDKPLGHLLWLGPKIGKGTIISGREGIRIALPKQDLTTLPYHTMKDGVFGALSIPAWTKMENLSLNLPLIEVLQPMIDIDLTQLFGRIAGGPGQILLRDTGGQITYLLTTDQQIIHLEQWKKIIRLAAAVSHPKIEPISLPDQSILNEMRADPEGVSIEEVVVAGQVTQKAAWGTDGYMLATQVGPQIIITNDQELLEFYLSPESGTALPNCWGKEGYIKLQNYGKSMASVLNTYSTESFLEITKKFGSMGINRGFFTTNLHFCY